MATPSVDTRASSVVAALSPYAWQRFTPQMLARWTISVVDGQSVRELMDCLPGVATGVDRRGEPVDADDVRIEPLVEALHGRHWRALTLERVAADLVAALEAWHAERMRLDAALERLLDEG